MILAIHAPHIGSHEVNTLLIAHRKMLDMVVTEDEKRYVECFWQCVSLPIQSPKTWNLVYTAAQGRIRTFFRRAQIRSTIPRSRRIHSQVNSEMLDLTLVVVDLISGNPSDPYWPQVKMLKALRLSVEEDDGLDTMCQLLSLRNGRKR